MANLDIADRVRVVENASPSSVRFEEVLAAGEPVVFRGLAADWPLVERGLESPAAAIQALKSSYTGKPVVGFTGPPEIEGRFFYNADMTGLNFTADRVRLDEFLDLIAAVVDRPDAPSYYIGSTDLDIYLPGLGAANRLPLDEPMFAEHPPLTSIWIGNRTVASAHFDMSNNIVCCVAGHRRFTLFPPGQVENLYPGPLEPTPGGQVVSMVDFEAPDLARYPRFADAAAAGMVADLAPGDVLFYPAMWWHHVEALDPFNIMINYWWNTSPTFMDTPMNTLLHALLSLRDRPSAEKQAWRALFDYYVFGPADRAAAHLPDHIRGNLAPLDEIGARRLRASLLNRLNR